MEKAMELSNNLPLTLIQMESSFMKFFVGISKLIFLVSGKM